MYAMNVLPETVRTYSSRNGTNPYASLCLQSGSTNAADVSFRIFIAIHLMRQSFCNYSPVRVVEQEGMASCKYGEIADVAIINMLLFFLYTL